VSRLNFENKRQLESVKKKITVSISS